jgi:hypothetical protein
MAGRIGQGGIIKDGLVLWLDASNPRSYPPPYNGNTWSDLTINGNNGTLFNGPTFNTLNSGSIVFDGTNDYVESGKINPTYFTISCWFRANGVPSTNDDFGGVLVISSPQLFGGVVQYSVAYSWSSQKLNFTVQNNLLTTATPNGSVLRNTIYNVTVLYNGLRNQIYVNGNFVTEIVNTTNPTYPTTGNVNVQIGRWGFAGFERYFNGNIYQTQIYNRALSASEVLQNYNATRGRFGL